VNPNTGLLTITKETETMRCTYCGEFSGVFSSAHLDCEKTARTKDVSAAPAAVVQPAVVQPAVAQLRFGTIVWAVIVGNFLFSLVAALVYALMNTK
jgi:hypothetical protein